MSSLNLYGYTVENVLICGYLREQIDRQYTPTELAIIICKYYHQIVPQFGTFYDRKGHDENFYGMQIDTKIKFDSKTNEINCEINKVFESSQLSGLKNHGSGSNKWWDLKEKDYKLAYLISVTSWNKQDLIETIKKDNDFDYIYKLTLEIKKRMFKFCNWYNI